MLETLAIGTFWFWTIIVIEIVVLFIFVANDNGWGATISLAIFVAILQWGCGIDLFSMAINNPIKLLAAGGAYVLIGITWGVIKWRLYCGDQLEIYNEKKADFLQSKGVQGTTVPPEHKEEWKGIVEATRTGSSYSNGKRGRTIADTPLIRNHKGRWTKWSGLWPISMIWGLINDFVMRIFTLAYRRIATYLQGIANSVFQNVNDDLE